MTLIEPLESRVCLSVTGASIVAEQAAIQTAATAGETDLANLFSVLGADDDSVYAAAATATSAKSQKLLSEIETRIPEAHSLFQYDLDTLDGGALSTTATAANDAAQILSSFSTTLEKALVADEKAMKAAVGAPYTKFNSLLHNQTVAQELTQLKNANGSNAPLRATITQRLADSQSLRDTQVAAAATLKAQVLAFVKSLKTIHGG